MLLAPYLYRPTDTQQVMLSISGQLLLHHQKCPGTHFKLDQTGGPGPFFFFKFSPQWKFEQITLGFFILNTLKKIKLKI